MEAYAVYIQKSGPRFRGMRACHVCSCRGGKEQCRWSRSNNNAVVAQVPKGEKLLVVIQAPHNKQSTPKDAIVHKLKDCRILVWFIQAETKLPSSFHNMQGDKFMVDGSKMDRIQAKKTPVIEQDNNIFIFETYQNMSDNPSGHKEGGDNYNNIDEAYPNVWV